MCVRKILCIIPVLFLSFSLQGNTNFGNEQVRSHDSQQISQRLRLELQDIRSRYSGMAPLPDRNEGLSTWNNWLIQDCLGSNPTEEMRRGCREIDQWLSASISGRHHVIP